MGPVLTALAVWKVRVLMSRVRWENLTGPKQSSGPVRSLRSVPPLGSSILIGPPINSGSAFTNQSLFFFGACVDSRPSFPSGSPIRTRPLLIVAHRVSPLATENHAGCVDYRRLQAHRSCYEGGNPWLCPGAYRRLS